MKRLWLTIFMTPSFLLAGAPIPKVLNHDHFDAIDISVEREVIVVLTESSPFLHLYEGQEFIKSFSRKGEGPGEFKNPRQVHIHERNVYVASMDPTRVTVFDQDGKYLETYSLRALFTSKVLVNDRHSYVQIGNFGAGYSQVIDFNSEEQDVILELAGAPKKKLTPQTGPSMTVALPFRGNDLWTMTKNNVLVHFRASNETLFVLENEKWHPWDLKLKEQPIPPHAFDYWLDETLPPNKVLFGRQNFHAAHRKEARGLEMPRVFPKAMGLISANDGSVWLEVAIQKDTVLWSRATLGESMVQNVQVPIQFRLKAVSENMLFGIFKQDGESYPAMLNR